MKFFTKRSGVEDGPYEPEALVKSVERNLIKADTLVRREDEKEWVPFKHHPALRPPPPPKRPFDPERDVMPETKGSFGLGFVAGFVGGCIGWIACEVFAKGAETKRGARIGVCFGIALGILLQLLPALARRGG